MKTGTFLKNARVNSGYTQIELGKKLGFSTPQFISNWERGIAPFPPKHAKQVSRLLSVKFDDLKKRMTKDMLEEFKNKF